VEWDDSSQGCVRDGLPPPPSSLRFLIHDDGTILSDRVTGVIDQLVMEPRRIVYRSPWQNESSGRILRTNTLVACATLQIATNASMLRRSERG
jgi:hypothetical protein